MIISRENHDFLLKYSRYTIHLTIYQSLQCKLISQHRNIPVELVFDEMAKHLESIEYRLYNMNLASKYGLTNRL